MDKPVIITIDSHALRDFLSRNPIPYRWLDIETDPEAQQLRFEVILEVQSELADEVRAGQLAYVVLENEVSAAQAAGASNNMLLKLAEERGRRGAVFSVRTSSAPGSRGTKITIRDLTQLDRLKVGDRSSWCPSERH